jgi:hypothetical protein
MIVNEEWKGRRGETAENITGRHTRVFVVQSGDFTLGSESVQAAAGVPRLGDTYVDANGNTDVTCVCVLVRPEQDNLDPGVWRVYAEYTTDAVVTPTLMPCNISWTLERFTRAIYLDLNGAAILNSAGDPFDPPVIVDDSRLVCRVTRNELSYPLNAALAYKDAVNSDAFLSIIVAGAPIAPGLVKMANIGADLVNPLTGRFRYWRVTYEMHVQLRGWQPKVLDAGFHTGFLGGILGFNRKLVRDPVSNEPLSQPVPLDGLGNVLAPAAAPVFITYAGYPTIAFNALGLPGLT